LNSRAIWHFHHWQWQQWWIFDIYSGSIIISVTVGDRYHWHRCAVHRTRGPLLVLGSAADAMQWLCCDELATWGTCCWLWCCCDGSSHCCYRFCWSNMGTEELPVQWHFLMVAGRGTSSLFLLAWTGFRHCFLHFVAFGVCAGGDGSRHFRRAMRVPVLAQV